MVNIVPQVDYQSRDFSSIRTDLINLIPNFAPQWTSRDDTDFGIVLIDLFAYMGDMLSYYIDRAANEAFISTATQRETVLSLARILGYTPTQPLPSQYDLVVTNNSTLSTTMVKTNAQFATDPDADGNQIVFEYLGSDTVVTTNPSTITVRVSEGQTVAAKQVGISDGTPYQSFPVYDDQYVYASSLSVQAGTTPFTRVDNIVDYGPTDNVYSTYYDPNNVLYIRFGDNASGKIPASTTTITASYRKGYGSKGNVGATTITNVVSNSTGDTGTFTVANTTATPAVSGRDPESTDSIRIHAPSSLRTINRAISISDYATIAQQSSTVAKANAVADNLSSVIVYVVGNNWDTGSFDSTGLSTVKSYYTGKTPPGTTVTVLPGTIVYPAVAVSLNVLPTTNIANAKAQALSALSTLFSFDNVTFNDVFYQGDIKKALLSVPGVNNVDVTGLERRTTSTTTASTTANPAVYFYVNEVPKYVEDNMNVTIIGGSS